MLPTGRMTAIFLVSQLLQSVSKRGQREKTVLLLHSSNGFLRIQCWVIAYWK